MFYFCYFAGFCLASVSFFFIFLFFYPILSFFSIVLQFLCLVQDIFFPGNMNYLDGICLWSQFWYDHTINLNSYWCSVHCLCECIGLQMLQPFIVRLGIGSLLLAWALQHGVFYVVAITGRLQCMIHS